MLWQWRPKIWRKYVKGERNRKGKKYYIDNGMIFEGEYLNVKKYGKGKEYFEFRDKLRYEGEYLNGK